MCPDEQLLSTYLDGELKEPWLSQVLEHLEWCTVCQQNLERLKNVKKATENAKLEEEKVETSKKRVLNFLNKNTLATKKKSLRGKLSNLIRAKAFWPVLSAVTTFCFCLIVLNPLPKKSDIIPYPDLPTILELDNIVPVRTTDNYTTDTTLKNYSLEEILKYLNDMGYEITLRNKKIEPLNIPQIIDNTEQLAPDIKLFNPPEKLEDPSSFNFKSELNEEDI